MSGLGLLSGWVLRARCLRDALAVRTNQHYSSVRKKAALPYPNTAIKYKWCRRSTGANSSVCRLQMGLRTVRRHGYAKVDCRITLNFWFWSTVREHTSKYACIDSNIPAGLKGKSAGVLVVDLSSWMDTCEVVAAQSGHSTVLYFCPVHT